MASLKGKVFAISGGASGIGLTLAKIAAKRGASLSICDVQREKLSDAVSALKSLGAEAISTVVNVTSSSEVDLWIEATVKHFGKLDGAANFAGVLGGKKTFCPLVEQTDEDWDFIMSINLRGVFYCMRAQLRVMEQGASIVNAASSAGLRGSPNIGIYSTSKHGVVGLTKSAAVEVGPRGIRVNAVAPGPIETPMLSLAADVSAQMGQPVTETYKNIPLRKNGQPEDVANLALFLLSDEAAYCTGAIYSVDGGLTT